MTERPCQRKGPITRDSILDEALGHLRSRDQWLNIGVLHRAVSYEERAAALIELVEVAETGSAGGYAEKQEDKDRKTLELRLAWLCSHPPRRLRNG